MESLSVAQARRIALSAQGFCDPRPKGRIDRRHLRRVLGRIGMLQIDSVNVLVRAHYMPLFSRLGPYDRTLLDRAAYHHRELFEYWGHAQSLLPVDVHPLLRWKMQRSINGETWGGIATVVRERPDYVRAVYEEVKARGPISAGELSEPGAKRGPWWGWSDGKRALEYLHWSGQVAALRRPSFEREYEVVERVLPPEVLAAPTLAEPDGRRALLALAARSLGVATAGDLAAYHAQRLPRARPQLAELLEAGVLIPVTVEGWKQPAYLHRDAVLPRRVRTSALVSPFDPLLWERDRTERLFGFRYRIEIYTPAPKREYGYYVLPFLLDDRLVARVDLKAERASATLAVKGAWIEPWAEPDEVAPALAAELASMAGWLGLDRVMVEGRGDLARSLRDLVASA